jgi:predicted dehydrogenase
MSTQRPHSQTTPSIAIALIGQRFMGRAHSNAWNQVARFFDVPLQPHLHTIAGRDADTLTPFAKRWGWAHATASWRDLASNTDVQLVDIATPNALHAEQAIAMLEAGKHVACEKPLARTFTEARLMRDAADRATGKTFVWFNYRRCPAVALAYKLLREGAIGRITHLRAAYLQSWGGPETPMSWRFEKAKAGSGAHGDLNAHLVDLARFLLNDEVSVVHGAVAPTFVSERMHEAGGSAISDVDDATLFLASFQRGTVASFEASRVATGNLNANTFEINGQHGALRFNLENMNVLEYYNTADQPRTDGWRKIICTRADAHPYVAAYWPDGHIIGYEHTFVNMAADILRVLGGDKPELPLPDFADALQTQRVLEAAMISAQQQCAVPLADVS